ncbi:hypothetical protein SAMN05421772_11116 [Paracoccus saliphilus]|uniref:Uncharacterized protein n=1 Tax=Paracoccus saliphilus TaxID=405559 RepID=A0AA45W5Y2_9RHOB|nr:hypothetical protein SAMN05421772_11116 [Paracoccus saliphilus]
MTRLYNYLMGRFYEARSTRALSLHHRFKKTAEKFFQRCGLDWDGRQD